MVSSILMKSLNKSEREVFGEIMKTDVFVKIFSDTRSQEEMDRDVDQAFEMFRAFERRMSRFVPDSELSRLNQSEESIVSEELFHILFQCRKYYEETGGIFDPSILGDLKREGYGVSIGEEKFGVYAMGRSNRYTFSDVSLDEQTRCVRKPKDLEIDLGGIGKGYIVDRVSERLLEEYANIFVCAGGDIRTVGADQENGYAFWVSDVENPFEKTGSVATLLLHDCGTATSGTNRRNWVVGKDKKHHLIDSRLKQSAQTDLITVTVVAQTTEQADVWAKTLCILGSREGMNCARDRNIAALFVDVSGNISSTEKMETYLWREDNK